MSCHVSCHSTGISDGRPASMCTHVWQKATTRSAERRPMSGLGTGNGRGKQKKNQRSSIRSPDHMSRVLRAAEGVVYVRAAGRAAATYARLLVYYLPRALRSLGAVAPRPAPVARVIVPPRPPVAPCVVVGALPPPADSSQLECTRRRRTTCRRRDHACMHARP